MPNSAMHAVIHAVIHTLPTRLPARLPDPLAAWLESVHAKETDALDRLAGLLQALLDTDPTLGTVTVYASRGGLISVCDANGTIVENLFPTEARAIVDRGLTRIRCSFG